MQDGVCSGDAAFVYEGQLYDPRRRFDRRPLRARGANLPSRRLVPAGAALQGHASVFEVQQHIMTMKAAQGLLHRACEAGEDAGRRLS